MTEKLRTAIGIEDESRRINLENRLNLDLNNSLEVHVAELFAAARAIREVGVLSVLAFMNEEVKRTKVELQGETVQQNLNEVAEVLDVMKTELPYPAELLDKIYDYQVRLIYKTGCFYQIPGKRISEIERYVQTLQVF